MKSWHEGWIIFKLNGLYPQEAKDVTLIVWWPLFHFISTSAPFFYLEISLLNMPSMIQMGTLQCRKSQLPDTGYFFSHGHQATAIYICLPLFYSYLWSDSQFEFFCGQQPWVALHTARDAFGQTSALNCWGAAVWTLNIGHWTLAIRQSTLGYLSNFATRFQKFHFFSK